MDLVDEESFSKTYAYEANARRGLQKARSWLPLKPSKELAETVADLLTDGHLAVKKSGACKAYPYIGFFSDDEKQLVLFNERLQRLFGVEAKIREWGKRINGRSKGAIACCQALSRVLEACGVPAGNKTTQEYSVPDWIRFGTREAKAGFLRRSFTCEGTVARNGEGGWKVRYSMCKDTTIVGNGISYLNVLRQILLEFGIETGMVGSFKYCKNGGRKRVELYFVLKRKSFQAFQEKIGFDSEAKNERLKKAVEQLRSGTARAENSGG